MSFTPKASASAVPTTGILLVLGSCLSLQFGAALATQLFPHAGASGTTFFRLIVAGLILIPFSRPKIRTWTAAQWRAVIFFGLSFGGMNTCFYHAIARIPLGTAVTIEFIGPLVLSALLSRNGRDFIWVGLAACGLGLLGFESLTGEPLDPIGVAFTLAAAVFWALYILSSARAGALVPGTGGLAMAVLIGALIPAPLGLSQVPTVLADPHLLLLAFGTGLLASVLPYLFEFLALRRMPSNIFSIMLSLEPAIAATAGWILLSQPIGLLGGVAACMVIAASIGITVSANRRARISSDPTQSAHSDGRDISDTASNPAATPV
ncbi:DMT family transporter [Corynebacterium sp. SCR221107]|uniref:EamA family transporter n=1 Tax=Corynebacterium sp. SCR221107 TaxID=3017361 RepID=UPI0022EC2824|nr:DMT family transporter [Corynebacterium sp. SCR221107]WBT09267.1 DMT family transporter [Corynebacterium sp. SCR221107]